MTKFQDIKEMDDKYVFNTYNRIPIILESGKGSRVVDSEGKEYIDMLAGIAVNALGHSHPKIVNAIKNQAEKIIHCSNFYYIEPQAKLAKILGENTDMDKVFFGNSGTEAVEGAMKLARKWGAKNNRGGKIITMKESFHGRSLAAVTATGQEKYKKGFEPLPEGFEIVPFGDIEAVKKAVDRETCAVMVEPVQGEGGIRPAKEEYLRALRELCDEEGILLIFDEVQCGVGRTGYLFAYQGYNVVPDILTTAKALGGGVPIGAFLAKEKIAETFKPGNHGTTFGGNPLATAAALAALETIIEKGLVERSREMGQYLKEELEKNTSHIPIVKEVRGRGLMIGVVLRENGKKIVPAMRKRGVLSNCTADNVIRLVPALNIPKEDIDKSVEVFTQALKEVFYDK